MNERNAEFGMRNAEFKSEEIISEEGGIRNAECGIKELGTFSKAAPNYRGRI